MSTLSILTWNMGMGFRHAKKDGEIWDRLEELIRDNGVDVALLNEVSTAILRERAPAALFEPWGTRGLDRKPRGWTTAILSNHDVKEIRDARARSADNRRPNVRFANSRPGSWVAARIELSDSRSLTCVSLYGLMDELSDASVHRALSDLSPLFSDPRYSRYLVMGGDLNITTQYRAGARLEACKAVLARIRAYGLVDCLDEKWGGLSEKCGCTFGPACRHTRTRLDPQQPHRPLQVDYVFASKELVEEPYECTALSLDEWIEYSDHAPILLKVQLPHPFDSME